ncbi:MAG: UMP kinase, partial [Clostridia bacterium]|nr:UMP kinase [Clostridia bacterium]
LKLSGEAISGGEKGILDFEFIDKIADVLKKCRKEGVEIAVVVGAGNIWRGAGGVGMDRPRADTMGMLGTMINSLGLEDAFNRAGLETVAMAAVSMDEVAEVYTSKKAKKYLSEGKVVIVGGGTGNPYFTTDTAAALRAAELDVDVALMAKNIDGVYNADPRKDKTAKRYDELTYGEIIEKNLRAIDLTAASFCMDNDIKTYVFELKDPENIYRVVKGQNVGTEIHK